MTNLPGSFILSTGLIFSYLYKFGSLFIFFALIFGIIGLPIPDEILLISAGSLIAHQKLNVFLTVLSAVIGSMIGITTSYLLGRFLGNWFIHKFGNKLHLTEKRVTLVKSWFTHYGKWILTVGYFIPLFRHVVGFAAGGIKIEYKLFVFYAYIGAAIWSLTFLTLGYFFDTYMLKLMGQ